MTRVQVISNTSILLCMVLEIHSSFCKVNLDPVTTERYRLIQTRRNTKSLLISDQSPTYVWSQTSTDCCAHFPLPPNTNKSDILYKLIPNHIELAVKNGQSFLDGDLHSNVDVDSCTWILENKRFVYIRTTVKRGYI